MSIPTFDLTRQYATLREAIDGAVRRVIETGQFIFGEEVEALETEVAAFLGVGHAVGVASGTDALHLALRALGVGTGDEVLVPAFTFVAAAEVVVYCGATPVFVDIDPEAFTMEPAAAAAAVTERTQAILPVHPFGHPASMEAIGALADRHGLAVVEDAAQAFGARTHGRMVGSLGRAGCFSFFPTKNLGAYGDGGMVVTDDAALAAQVRQLRHHGAAGRYRHPVVGYNSRLDALQAAILRAKLPHLEAWNVARRRHAHAYTVGLGKLEGLVCPTEAEGVHHVYHQYTIRTARRDALHSHLADHRIGAAIYYPVPLPAQEAFGGQSYREGSFPESERAARDVLSLPMFPELTEEEVGRVVRAVQGWVEGA
ncbi:MAG: DegT/DnrJ/EryC1/StrS family aminotransferase [Candidatus Tectimicrobiota bacterium]